MSNEPISDSDFKDLVNKFMRVAIVVHPASTQTLQFSSSRRGYGQMLELGRSIRDEWLSTYSILPGAVGTFIDIAVSREWLIAGKPKSVTRTIKKLHNISFLDAYGLEHKGWEQFMARACMDWLTIGRLMYHSPVQDAGDYGPISYIDPVKTKLLKNESGVTEWVYDEPDTRQKLRYTQEEMFFVDDGRKGGGGSFMGRLAPLLAVATMDYMLRDHDMMQLDGRKIRDIIFVREGVSDALKAGMMASMALTAGEDPSKHGLPVVEIQTMGDDMPIKDMIHIMGISSIPKDFTREEFRNSYAREISTSLGLPLGQFWHDPRGTNRSLEQVTQERSTLKGPSYFVRSLARSLNYSGVFGKTPATKGIIIFDEETDNSSLSLNAKALNDYADAATKLHVLGEDSPWHAFLQRKHLIPPDITLPDIIMQEESSLGRAASVDSVDEVLEKGWIMCDMNERVISRRSDFQMQVKGKDETPES